VCASVGDNKGAWAVCLEGVFSFVRGTNYAPRANDLSALSIPIPSHPSRSRPRHHTLQVDFIIAFLAVTAARAIAAPLNAAYKESEFAFYLEDAGSKLLLLSGGLVHPGSPASAAPRAAAAALRVPVAGLAAAWGFGGKLSVSVTPQSPSLRPLPPRAPDAANAAALRADPPRPADVALFLHTSGTTSRPKGVPLSHANLCASLSNIAATYELTPADCSFLVMPLFHVHGLMAGLLAPLAAGSGVGLPPEGRFAASTFWAGIAECGASFYTAVPTMHQVLLARGPGERAAAGNPRLRFIRSCSSALAAPTLEKLEAAFGAPVLEAYAMTEASHQMTANPLPSHGPHKPGTVGKAAGSVRVAILDPTNAVITQPGVIGEVCIQGPNVTAGYRNNPAANAEAYAGGWFHTGDQGSLDAEGYLTLTGRLKELINRGGEKISPLEVDAALLAHPSVGEAVAFGAPDEKYGEVVAAAVVLVPGAAKEGAAEAIAASAAQRLAAFKVPTRIFITDALPKTATGKVQRRFVAEHFCKGGGGSGGGGGAGTAGARSKL
jgi:oxalate---CoA ligase